VCAWKNACDFVGAALSLVRVCTGWGNGISVMLACA
jgi:hypothetical protein